MEKWPDLSNPPVQEAVLDLRFNLIDSDGSREINSFYSKISNDFPIKKERIQLNLSAKFGDTQEKGQGTLAASHKSDGLIINSKDQKTAIQVGSNFFSFHILKPYRQWPAILEESKSLWETFYKGCKTMQLNRIALRYINRIVKSDESLKFDPAKHLKLIPSIPDGINYSLDNYFMQLNLANHDRSINAIINEKVGRESNQHVDIVLDIDVFKLYQNKVGDAGLWDDVVRLREFKNEIFFNSITTETRNKFQ